MTCHASTRASDGLAYVLNRMELTPRSCVQLRHAIGESDARAAGGCICTCGARVNSLALGAPEFCRSRRRTHQAREHKHRECSDRPQQPPPHCREHARAQRRAAWPLAWPHIHGHASTSAAGATRGAGSAAAACATGAGRASCREGGGVCRTLCPWHIFRGPGPWCA